MKIHEIEVNKGETSNATISSEPAVTNTKGDVKALDDKNLSTLFHAQNIKAGDKLEYRLTDNVNLDSFSVFQGEPCNAKVTLVKSDNTEQKLSDLTEGKQDFNNIEGKIHAIRFDFVQGKDAELNEIVFRYGENPSDDIGVAVDNIYIDSTEPETEDVINLALNQKVEVSDVEKFQNSGTPTTYTGNLSVDGDKNTRWSSGALNNKSYGEITDQWLILDMGEKPVLINEMQIDFYKKVWPTEYQIQVSNNKENWVTLETITRESASKEGISDKKTFENPLMARYIRLYFPKEKLNTEAAGGSVSITELTVKGIRKSTPLTYMEVTDKFEEIHVENDAKAEDLQLANIVNVKMANADKKEIAVQVLPKWNTEGFDEAKDVNLSLKGELPKGTLLVNDKNVEAVQKVVKGTPQAEDLTGLRKALQNSIDAAEKMISDAEANHRLYDVSTINALKPVLDSAKEVLANEESGKEDLENAKAELDAAIVKVEKLNLTAFDKAVAQAQKVDKDLYTDESVQQLESALAEAGKLFDAQVTQDDVDKMTEVLETAYKGLAVKPEPEPQPEPQPEPLPEPQPEPNPNPSVPAEPKPEKPEENNKKPNVPSAC